MDTPGPLAPVDPNIPSRHIEGKTGPSEKPLPPAPHPFDRTRSETSVFGSAMNMSESPSNVTRPSMNALPSFQRPRKRVIWRNKACIIALPLENEFGRKTSRESYLGSADVAKRMEDWDSQGYDTRGFVLASPSAESAPFISEGQSRAIHPDPEGEKHERSESPYRVSIPDRREWEAYVDQLKEEKLRALGVSFGDDELLSRKSPAPSLMSRQASSQNSSMLVSPPLAPASVHAVPFTPPFQESANPNVHPSKQAVSHFPRYSMAMPFGDKTFPPQNQFPQSQSPVHGSWSPQHYLSSQPGSRVASPMTNGYLPGLGNALSPQPPPVQNSIHQISTQDSSDLLARMRRQQSALQAQYLQQQHQQQQQVLRPRPQSNSMSPPKSDVNAHPAQDYSRPEIATPIPRGHRQNPSETLQREVDEAEAHLEESARLEKNPENSRVGKKENELEGPAVATKPHDTPLAPMKNGSTVELASKTASTSESQGSLSGRPGSKHGSKSSVSKLNVNAPEFKFEPKASFAPEVFAFLGDQQPAKAKGSGAPKGVLGIGHSKKPSYGLSQPTKFNVSAPAFTPGAAAKPKVPSREFSFSSSGPAFRPEAPAFKPSESVRSVSGDTSNKENPIETVKKIFGDIDFSDVIKPTKESRAIPIVKPNEILEKPSGDPDGQEDESGRITQAEGRQKRMRREQDDGNEVPLFGTPNLPPWQDHGGDERSAYFGNDQSSTSESGEPTILEGATDLLEEIIDDLSASEASSLMHEDESSKAVDNPWEPHAFHDADEAASFNAALPPGRLLENQSATADPTPQEIAEGTRDYLEMSHQFKSEFDRQLERRTSVGSSISSLSEDPERLRPEGRREDDQVDRIDYAGPTAPLRQDVLDGVRYVEPSYQEIDEVMKHLNREDDSDIGVERHPSQWRESSPTRDRSRSPLPSQDSSVSHQPMAPAHIRSDAPSPSPNKLREPFQYLPPTDSESADTAAIEMVARNARFSPSFRPSKNSPPIHRLNSPGSTPPSDWNDAISSLDEAKFQSRTGFFDNRVNDLVGNVVRQRLGPLEKTLSGIQQSLAALSSRSASRRPRSSGTVKIENSDADDEDEIAELSRSRHKSPLRDRKYDQLKSSLNEITAAQQGFAPVTQLAEVMDAVKDLKASVQQAPAGQTAIGDIKGIVEEAIARQMRGRSAPVTMSSQSAAAEKNALQIAGLESMLKIADARAEDELKARRHTEDALADNQRLLRQALQEAAEQRESAEETERSLQEYHEERHQSLKRLATLEGSQESLERTASELSEKNAALEDTLAEYRLSSDQWRTEIDDAKHENKDLRRTVGSLNAEIEDSVRDRQALRAKFDLLQENMASASRDLAADQSRWRTKEEEHKNRLEMLSARLEAEARTRERLELEIERLEAQEKESMKARVSIEQTQKANAHLDKLVGQLRSEVHEHQNAATRFERDFHAARETSIMEVHRTKSAMDVDIEAAKSQVSVVRADLQSAIARLEKQLADAQADAETARGRHELMLEEAAESRHAALREAQDAREAALQEHYRFHERTVEELKGQHQRALDNALDDKQRSETYFGARLNLADEKVTHYEDRVTHLEEKLGIAKSAAHAAVQAAQAKKGIPSTAGAGSVIPTSASSIPEKISPQALRESIMVLQEQLQAREGRIEQLESELAAVDTTAPANLKDAEIEITWLRELLGVRIDDLQDIITTLSQPRYDREAVKDAAIRLKANLQMEQQEKERAMAGGQTFPSLSSISNLAASPRALPLAAAAAWGNWRKSRDSGFGNLSAIANGSANHSTPSKSSPQSFFAGLMTPPSTDMRSTPPLGGSRPSSSSSRQALQAPVTPRKQMSSSRDGGPSIGPSAVPTTPPLMRKASYDLDARESDGFGADGSASMAEAEADAFKATYDVGADEEEPFGPKLGTFAA